MKKTFTIILSILLLASCINNDYKETQKLISEADNFDIKTLSKITSTISDSKYSEDEALEIRNLYVQYLNDMGSLISDSINTLIFSTDRDNYKIEEIIVDTIAYFFKTFNRNQNVSMFTVVIVLSVETVFVFRSQ